MGDRMNDKIREEFEAAYVENMVRIMGEGIRKRAFDNTKFLMQNGEFQDPALRLALWAWRASREALVIELPQGLMPAEVDHHSDLPLMYTGAVVAAIEAASLKVKP